MRTVPANNICSPFIGGGQSGNGVMSGMAGLNIGALAMNPALVAAAINQASWGLIGGLQVPGIFFPCI